MLIKSQNGTRIINLDNYNGICIGNPNESDYTVCVILEMDAEHVSQVEIGRYSSEDKAKKSLNWFLDCYNMNRLLEVAPETRPRDLFDEYVTDQNFGVFQMPSDEEVEE